MDNASFELGECSKKKTEEFKSTDSEAHDKKHGTSDEDNDKKELGPVPFLQLFRLSSRWDRVMLFVAVGAAIVSGMCYPTMNVLCGERAGIMVNMARGPIGCNQTNSSNSNLSPEAFEELKNNNNDEYLKLIGTYSIYLVGLGLVELVSSYLYVSIFRRTAEKMIYRLRVAYLRAVLRQEIGWYDTVQDRNFVSKLSDDLEKMLEATGEKVGFFIYNIACSFFCLVSAFYYGWLLSLVILASLPVMSAWSYLVSILQSRLSVKEQQEYSKSGAVAQEALANIRTVMAFGGQELEIERYERGLVYALAASRKKGILSALGNGIMWLLNYATLALTLWYGMKLILDGRANCGQTKGVYGPAEFIVVFFSITYASFRFGIAMSYLQKFSSGRAAAAGIYQVLDQTPVIDSYADTGINPKQSLRGKIQFRQVRFSYPSRPDVPILRGLDLCIPAGMTVAFVGNSGCGKSTCLQLLQRFYDPNSGSVWVDDTNVRDYNIRWYRSNIGVVSQEPVLFDTSIAENIRYGRSDVTQDEIEAACRISNAHAFISRLPKKYETLVGERGAQLSGGQKQRIAIARALVRNPKILLLDEATSALDTQSERVVQQALDKASKGRTTLIVAHRLSTIRNADLIVAFDEGKVVEMGTHEDLIAKKGFYHQLVTTQVGDWELANNCSEDDPRRRPSEQDEDEFTARQSLQPESEDVEDDAHRSSFFRLFQFSATEWPLLAVGLIMAILNGLVLPTYSYFFGQIMGVMAEADPDVAREKTNVYAIVFLIIGACAGITDLGSNGCFSLSGEILTDRLRKMAFRTMLKQDVAWFDDQKNSVGALCSRLSGDAASIQGATGSWLGMITQAMTTIVFSIAISFYVLPKVAAVAIVFSPLIFVATYVSDKMMETQQVEEKAAMEQGSKLVYQAVTNIRTVASLCREKDFVDSYSAKLRPAQKKGIRQAHMFALVQGISQSSFFFAYALINYYGAYLIRYEGIDYSGIFVVGEGLLWVMFLLGQNLAYAPNYNKGKVAGGRMLKLLSSKPKIESSPTGGSQLKNFDGRVDFTDVEFRYPTRADTKVLKGLSFAIEPHVNVGICGPSGSGKSTCIQLLLRYYDPEAGTVRLEGSNVGSLNVGSLRSQMALVSQEPALFDRTLAENIAYGDNTRKVGMDEIIEAARAANVHEFITSLPGGYSTRVGDMGGQLSGGQKQRVAIARALVRNPKLLLLDEATSALDAESEKIVQAALDNATAGRTCITIAHRLSSIQHADRILVMNNGSICESGTHDELLRKGGVYYKLWKIQHHSQSS